MRFLIVSQYLPSPFDKHGVFQRLRTFVEAFDRLGDLSIVFFVGPHKKKALPEDVADLIASSWNVRKPDVSIEPCGQDLEPQRLLTGYLMPMISMFHQPGYVRMSGAAQVAAIERNLDNSPDLVFVHRLGAMCPFLLSRRQTPPIVFDLDDIEHKAFARSISRPPSWRLKRLQYLRLPALWLGERAAIRKATTTFVCSGRDRADLQRTMRVNSVTVVPNTSAQPAGISPASAAPPTILFVGTYVYPPNSRAADILIRKVWPIVCCRIPDAQLVIAGAHPEQIPAYASAPQRVEFPGFVDDLSALYARTRMVCAPIQDGGGTRIKIIEAAMYARPVVATTIAAEGLEFVAEEQILIADVIEEIAGQCVRLLSDPTLCDLIGSAAKNEAILRYGRESAINMIEAEVKNALSSARG